MDLADPNQWNAYAYSHNNPTTFSDPTGLKTKVEKSGGLSMPLPPPPPPSGNKKNNPAGGILKGLYTGWVKYSTAPIEGIVGLYKAGEDNILKAASGERTWLDAWVHMNNMAGGMALQTITSPITITSNIINKGDAIIDAARTGDWEGVGEHSYNTAANIAELVTMAIPASRFSKIKAPRRARFRALATALRPTPASYSLTGLPDRSLRSL